MASLGHLAVGLAGARVLQEMRPTLRRRQIFGFAIGSAILADIDVLALPWIAYEAWLGHRGATHSLLFAVGIAWFAAYFLGRPQKIEGKMLMLFTLLALSHIVLDAMSNAGLGVALFWPFSESRFFLPWRPIPTTRLDSGFFSIYQVKVLLWELLVFSPLIWWGGRPFLGSKATAQVGQ